MATKKIIKDNVPAVGAENIETANNLSQEETNKTETQPAVGTEKTDAPITNSSQGIDGVSPLQNSESVESPESNFMLFDKGKVEKGKDAFKPTIGELKEAYPNKAKTTKRKESHIEKLKRERAEKKAAKAAFHANEKEKFSAANPNDTFEEYKYDNTAYNPRGEHLIGKEDKDLTSREIRQRNKAEQKLAENEQDYEKFMSFVRDYDKYNQYGGSFNYDQFTSSVDPKTIRAAAKALGVGGLARVGIATQELYNAARKELQKKVDVAYQEQQAIQAEKKKAEDALKDRIKDDAKLNDLQEYIYNFSQALSGDPKDFEANQEGFIKGLQQRLADAGFKTRVDGIPAQQTFRRAIEAMAERNPELKDLFVASGVMMPEGYEKSTPLEEFLNGSDKGRADYELRFAQRRDQRNRFNQSLVDLAGITSRMIAASGGAKMEPYKNDMYDKFREDMKAARQRYDERMGEIRQREIDAEKEAYARIREREKAAQEQANLDRAFTYQQTQDRIKNAIEKGRLDLAAEELRLKKDENSPYYKSMMYQTRLNFLQNYKPADWAIMERYINGEDVDISGIMPVVKESTVNYNYNGVKPKTGDKEYDVEWERPPEQQ